MMTVVRRIGVWITLLAFSAWPWVANPLAPRVIEATRPPSLSAPEPLASFPDLATLAETIERPLFTASRRPPPSQPTATPSRAASQLAGYRVTGIVRSSAKRMILLTEERTDRIVQLYEGDKVDGWTLTSIGSASVSFTRDGHVFDLLEPGTQTNRSPSTRNTRWLPSSGVKR